MGRQAEETGTRGIKNEETVLSQSSGSRMGLGWDYFMGVVEEAEFLGPWTVRRKCRQRLTQRGEYTSAGSPRQSEALRAQYGALAKAEEETSKEKESLFTN